MFGNMICLVEANTEILYKFSYDTCCIVIGWTKVNAMAVELHVIKLLKKKGR